MKQKTLNKIRKYCRYSQYSFGAVLYDILTMEPQEWLQDITDAEISRRFSKLYLQFRHPKRRVLKPLK